MKVGDVDNDITCTHSSDVPDYIQSVRWKANCFNAADTTTPAKFKELCLAYVARLGFKPPEGLFAGIDPSKGQEFETPEATFKLERISYKIGYGWIFTVTGKN